jgi:hypothetical protein
VKRPKNLRSSSLGSRTVTRDSSGKDRPARWIACSRLWCHLSRFNTLPSHYLNTAPSRQYADRRSAKQPRRLHNCVMGSALLRLPFEFFRRTCSQHWHFASQIYPCTSVQNLRRQLIHCLIHACLIQSNSVVDRPIQQCHAAEDSAVNTRRFGCRAEAVEVSIFRSTNLSVASMLLPTIQCNLAFARFEQTIEWADF